VKKKCRAEGTIQQFFKEHKEGRKATHICKKETRKKGERNRDESREGTYTMPADTTVRNSGDTVTIRAIDSIAAHRRPGGWSWRVDIV
jgi:hypothetical protein